MNFSLSSLRFQFTLMIVLVSSVGILSSIFIVNMNYKNSIEETRKATVELVKQESITLSEKHSNLLNEFGLRIQKNPEFRKAIKEKNKPLIQKIMNEEFSLYYVSLKILVINKIYAFDANFNLITESTEGEVFDIKTRLCNQLVKKKCSGYFTHQPVEPGNG